MNNFILGCKVSLVICTWDTRLIKFENALKEYLGGRVVDLLVPLVKNLAFVGLGVGCGYLG
jgi:hypothetical protein